MRHFWPAKVVGILLVALIVGAGFGFAVMQLWNWLMPYLFGLPVLTFWKAVGLLLLSWIFFGSWRGFHGRGGHWRHRMHERWEKMTPEQREEFRKAMEKRCGRWSAPSTPSTPESNT